LSERHCWMPFDEATSMVVFRGRGDHAHIAMQFVESEIWMANIACVSALKLALQARLRLGPAVNLRT